MIEAGRRLEWLNAQVIEVQVENFQVKTIVSEASGWTNHAAGQHVDIRLTAPDGYQAQRSYSIANAPGDGQQVWNHGATCRQRRGLAVPSGRTQSRGHD